MGNNEILVAKPVRDFQQTVRSEAGLQFSRVGRSHLTLSPSPCAGPSELVRLEGEGSVVRFEVKVGNICFLSPLVLSKREIPQPSHFVYF